MAKLIIEVEDAERSLLELANLCNKFTYHSKMSEGKISRPYHRLEKGRFENKIEVWLRKNTKRDYVVDDEEIEICSFFGCGAELSLVEKLAGNKCTGHMGAAKTVFHNGLL